MHIWSQPSGRTAGITSPPLKEQSCVLTLQVPLGLICDHKDLHVSYITPLFKPRKWNLEGLNCMSTSLHLDEGKGTQCRGLRPHIELGSTSGQWQGVSRCTLLCWGPELVSWEGLTERKSTGYVLRGELRSNQVHDQGYEEPPWSLRKEKTVAFIYSQAFGVQQNGWAGKGTCNISLTIQST